MTSVPLIDAVAQSYPVAVGCCYSTRCERNFVFNWSIRDFICAKERPGEILPSTKFNFKCMFHEYSMHLNIRGSTCKERSCEVVISARKNASINFAISASKNSSINFAIQLSVNEEQFNTAIYNSKYQTLLINKLQHCLLSSNPSIIRCELFNVSYETVCTIKNQNFPLVTTLKQDLVELFTNKKHWDITLVVAGHELRAHKCILASRSEVFAAMFEHEMEENKSNIVVITDIDLDVFEELLRYIYTDEVLNLSKMASELLAASEKYGLKNLKSMCAYELSTKISIETAVETMMVADLYRSTELKKIAINFINANRRAIANTKSWEQIVNNIDFLAELYLNN